MFLLDTSFWEIKTTRYAGRGVFACREIPAGTVIGDYIGMVIRPEEDPSDNEGMYNMWVGGNTLVRASPEETGVHIINHSCEADCGMYPYHGHVLIFALRKLFPGEELTLQYLIDPPEERPAAWMHVCACGSITCRGTLHGTEAECDRWGAYLDKRFREDGQFTCALKPGELLRQLGKYPDRIGDDSIYDLFGTLCKPPMGIPDITIPDIETIRRRIRSSGRRLELNNHAYCIYGVKNSLVLLASPTK